MNPGLYSQLAEIEDIHWWHVSRRQMVEDHLIRLYLDKHIKGLDIGCGTGGNLRLLEKYCDEVSGLDLSDLALELAKKRWQHHNFIKGNANSLADIFDPDTFGLITIFHVLYHEWITSESSVLRQVYQILKPGGYLVVTEPSFNILKRKHDIQDMGERRYRLKPFEKILKETGFILISSTYFNCISFLPALIVKAVEHMITKKNNSIKADEKTSELNIPGAVINNFIINIMAIERKIIGLFGKVPLGVSLLCVVRKPC